MFGLRVLIYRRGCVVSNKLADYVRSVRSKNAGPFWVTIDIFCGNETAYELVRESLSTEQVSEAMRTPVEKIKRFEIPSINVIKYSLPRPITQGHYLDRDMHGAQWAVLLQELELTRIHLRK